MATEAEFDAAVERVQNLPERPGNDGLLELYGWFKQATVGDVSGKRPGMMNLRGRAKWDAWAQRKGQSAEAARAAYIAVVDRLEKRAG